MVVSWLSAKCDMTFGEHFNLHQRSDLKLFTKKPFQNVAFSVCGGGFISDELVVLSVKGR